MVDMWVTTTVVLKFMVRAMEMMVVIVMVITTSVTVLRTMLYRCR